MNKRIALDLDSVLADVVVIWIDEYNKRKNTNLTKEFIKEWDIHTILPIEFIDVHNLFNYVWENRWKDIPPIGNSLKQTILNFHNDDNKISILTRRDRKTVSFVAKWLDYHEIYSDDLLFIYDSTPKSYYPFDILVDDAPINLKDIEPPRMGIVFDQPWNRHFIHDNRIRSLDELWNYI